MDLIIQILSYTAIFSLFIAAIVINQKAINSYNDLEERLIDLNEKAEDLNFRLKGEGEE